MSIERNGRHHPSRTLIPGRFVDLGNLFDEDSRNEYLRTPDLERRAVRNTQVSVEEIEEEGEEEVIEEPNHEVFVEDFIIHENGITLISEDALVK